MIESHESEDPQYFRLSYFVRVDQRIQILKYRLRPTGRPTAKKNQPSPLHRPNTSDRRLSGSRRSKHRTLNAKTRPFPDLSNPTDPDLPNPLLILRNGCSNQRNQYISV